MRGTVQNCAIILLVLGLCFIGSFSSIASKNLSGQINSQKIITGISGTRLPFIRNRGQLDDNSILFYAKGFYATTFIKKNGEILYLFKDMHSKKTKVILKEILISADITQIIGKKRAETRVSYFKGKDPQQWKKNIPSYYVVDMGEVFPAVFFKLKAHESSVEKIFKVNPGGKPSEIKLRIFGAKGIKISENGELQIETQGGPITFSKPLAYQEINGERLNVDVSYTVIDRSGTYAFKVGDYDSSHPLYIDPLLASTYLGGKESEFAYSVAIGPEGNVYVAGSTCSSDFPATDGAYDTDLDNQSKGDGFVTMFDPSLTQLLASTFIGGNERDDIVSMSIDRDGNVFIAGVTSSQDFPVSPSAFDTSFNGEADSNDCFVAKLSSDLGDLISSTYLGGNANDIPFPYPVSIAINPTSGDIYIAGTTESSDFPTTSGSYDVTFNGEDDAFVSRLDNDLKILKSSTFLGGSGEDQAYIVTIRNNGNIYVAGRTISTDFPATPDAYDTTFSGSSPDCFVSCFDPDLKSLLSSTALGGDNSDYAYSAALGNGGIYIVGRAVYGFPTTEGAFSEEDNGGLEGFIAKLDYSLTHLLYSTFLGGSDDDYIRAIALDNDGNIYVAGKTHSTDFPVTEGAFDTTFNGLIPSLDPDGFIAKLSPDLSNLLESTFWGGKDIDYVRSIIVSKNNDVYVSGYTRSFSFPTTGTCAYDDSLASNDYDAFVSKFAASLARESLLLSDALDNDTLIWITGGDAQWFGTREFAYFDCDAARSGEIGSNKISWINTSVDGPGILDFFWYIKNINTYVYLDHTSLKGWYSTPGWVRESTLIPEGHHEIIWICISGESHNINSMSLLDKVSYLKAPAFLVTKPDAGEVVSRKGFMNIKWIATEDTASTVKVQLLKSDQSLITKSVENSGTYDLFLPAGIPPGNDYRIKISSLLNPNVYDYSDEYFTIAKAETDELGEFLLFDSSAQFLKALDHSELRLGNTNNSDFTIEAWLYHRWSPRTAQIVKKPNSFWEFGLNDYFDGGVVRMAIYFKWIGEYGKCSITCGQSPPINEWVHVAVVRSGDKMKLYINGKAGAEMPITGNILDSEGGLIVGQGLGTGLPEGLDEVRISDIARYTDNFDPPITPFTCDEHTLALWHFEEPSTSNTFHDECGVDNVLFRMIHGDTDQDGDVDGKDLAEFANAFGSSSGEENFNPACDLHENGVINEQDLESFAQVFGN